MEVVVLRPFKHEGKKYAPPSSCPELKNSPRLYRMMRYNYVGLIPDEGLQTFQQLVANGLSGRYALRRFGRFYDNRFLIRRIRKGLIDLEAKALPDDTSRGIGRAKVAAANMSKARAKREAVKAMTKAKKKTTKKAPVKKKVTKKKVAKKKTTKKATKKA